MTIETINAYPLQWPAGKPRTPAHKRTWSRFKATPDQARRELIEEMRRLGLRRNQIIVSTNVELRQDGEPYANRRDPNDTGVALYWTAKDGTMQCIACDLYRQVWENMRALSKSIECIRALERWGGADIMEQAFRGFAQLPAPMTVPRPWHEVLEVDFDAGIEECRARFRTLAQEHHPDKGGDHDRMAEINAAWEACQKALKAIAL